MTFDWRPAFFTRVTAGLFFAMAGVHKVFIMTPQVHARKLFLEPYQHTWIPHFLLWSLGLGIPIFAVRRDQPRFSASHGYIRPCVAGTLFQRELTYLAQAHFAAADSGSSHES
jgi:hypothetical protein